jgi:hypothetical protein
MHIKIVATPLMSNGDEEEFHWTVNIFSDGEVLKQDLSLRDPLNKDERSDCRWYLEQYLGHEPYSTTRARGAATLLQNYGQSLVNQLQLSDLISEDVHNLTIDIEDISFSSSGQNSVHQLSWEFLEDGNLWKIPSLSVCVRRSSGIPGQTLLASERMASWSCAKGSRQQINILLVTARDLGKGSMASTDINPSIVSDLLAGVKSRLKSAKALVDLNVEVVRPGSWEALKLHLDKSHRLHGHGYFHIIHFDVHGRVKRKGKRVGLLYFSHPKHQSTMTRSVLASIVAREVGKHGIHIAILNACESARANAGEDANIAHNFSRAGVKNVLAMSYKASESAMRVFLEGFYVEFLVKGKNFTDSAMFARRMLRLQPTRQARFQLCSPLCDWFVPVVYTSSPELSLVRADVVNELSIMEENHGETTEGRAPCGREFDLLRLEKALVANEPLYLFGPPGIGKTTFLRYVVLSWRSTSFVDAVVFLDFSTCNISSMDDFFKETIQQLHTCNVMRDSDQQASEYDQTNAEAVLDILADSRVAFILDGLVDFRVSIGRHVEYQQNMTLLVPSIIRFMEQAMSQPGELREESHIVIVSGRVKELGELMGHSNNAIDLGGLRLMEAVDLVHQFSAPPSYDRPDDSVDQLAEIRKTELLAHLLQGNPAALVQVSLVARDSAISPRQMYDILHSESPMHKLDPSLLVHHLELLREFRHLIFTLPEECTAVLLILSWYWHEGPFIPEFAEMLVTLKIASDESTVRKALQHASRWGYIELHLEDDRVSWIHSLLTVFCRIIACSSYSGFRFSTGNELHDFQTTFAARAMGHLVVNAGVFLPWPPKPMKGLEYAVRLVHTVLSPYFFRDVNENYWMCLIYYLRTHENSNRRLSSLLLSKSAFLPGMMKEYDLCKQNFIFILKLCRGRGSLPLPQIGWPMHAIGSVGHYIRRGCNMEETCIIAKYYEELLKGAVIVSKSTCGKNVVKTEDLGLILRLASALAELHRRDIPQSESRHMEIIEFATEIAEESEKVFGSSSDPSIVSSKGQLSIVKATALLEDAKFEDSQLEWQKVVGCFQNLYDPSDPVIAARFEKFLEGQRADEVRLWRRFISTSSSVRGAVQEMWDLATNDAMGEPATRPIRFNRVHSETISSTFTEMFREIAPHINEPASRLQALETEMSRGHWLRAMGHHSGFVITAIENFDFNQALEHVQAQENLAIQHEPGGKFLKKATDATEVIRSMQSAVSALTSNSGLDSDKLKPLEEFTQKLQNMGIASPELIQMNEIVQESAVLDNDPNLIHNSAPGILQAHGDQAELVKTFLQKHLLASSRDPAYQQRVVRSMANVLSTLRDLERAEDTNDDKGIFQYLAQIDELAKHELCSQYLNESKIQERRLWNSKRLLRDSFHQAISMVESENFEQAHILAAKCDRVISLGYLTPEMRDEIENNVGKVEIFVNVQYFTHLVQAGNEAVERHDLKAALKFFNDALELQENNDFSKVPSSFPSTQELTKTVKSERFSAFLHLAVSDHRWDDGVVCCKDWRAEDELWRNAMEGSTGSKILRMQEMCTFCSLIQELFKSVQRMDLISAALQLNNMKQSYNFAVSKQDSQKAIMSYMFSSADLMLGTITRTLYTSGWESAYRVSRECLSLLQESNLPIELSV